MAESNGYTKFPNWLLDEAMPNCTNAEWRILCFIARKTVGWGVDSARISIKDFMLAADIDGRQHVVSAISRLLEKGYITREADGQWFNYSLQSSNLKLPVTLSNQLPKVTTSSNLKLPDVVTLSNQFAPILKKERKLKKEEPLPVAHDDDHQKVIRAYEQEIGVISRNISDKIDDALKDFSTDMIIDAIKVAVENNVRKWSYIEGILKRWKTEGRGAGSKVRVNGTFPQAAWDKVCKAVSRQVYSDLTDQEKTALKAVGLTNIRMRDTYNEPKLKTAFYEAMKQ